MDLSKTVKLHYKAVWYGNMDKQTNESKEKNPKQTQIYIQP